MRLDNPHPDSFLYFAARLREDETLCRVSPDLLIAKHCFTARGAGVVKHAAVENFQQREAIYTSSYLQGAQKRDEALDMSNPAVRFLAETCGSYASLLQARAEPAPEIRRGADGWRPTWQTVDGIVFGAWLATGAESCSSAAQLLNSEPPRFERLGGRVGRCAVHRSLEREISRFARNSPLGHEITFWTAAALVQISEVRAALAVWKRLHVEKGRNTVGAYWRGLRLDGRLFEMKTAAEEAELIASTGLRQEAEASAWVIHGRVLAHLMKVAAERHVIEQRQKPAEVSNAWPS
ncbi:hypothetical protein EV667_0707 [Ancylobacter aquaticus]|uniref:Uncharacterized protein n=1 Tax=Ancylobacter aquaticus TaxID=100 RepID=A0A4R1I8X9_ANCAQ|nr:hypothetical protein [Ancylobacter aquaticus]TCK30613.1 hypothetical protein EV667_0707 [Ancylobacter aquaticus]